MSYYSKDIKECPFCHIKLVVYFERFEENFTKKLMYRRCPKCVRVFPIKIYLKERKC